MFICQHLTSYILTLYHIPDIFFFKKLRITESTEALYVPIPHLALLFLFL